MATIRHNTTTVDVPKCKHCGSDLRFKGIHDTFLFINGEKVTMCCRKCKTESKVTKS